MQCNVVQIISYLLNKFSEVLLQPRLRDSFYWEHFLTFVFWYTALNLFYKKNKINFKNIAPFMFD